MFAWKKQVWIDFLLNYNFSYLKQNFYVTFTLDWLLNDALIPESNQVLCAKINLTLKIGT